MSKYSADVKPDIFITGVMKGGTTILYDYLCTHPDICRGSQKELHYFSLYYDKGDDWYASHFEEARPDQRVIDASPTYFDTAQTALTPRLIRMFNPDARSIVITRDPIIRAISQFLHLKNTNKIECLQQFDADTFFDIDIRKVMQQTSPETFFLNQVLTFSMYFRKFMIYRDVFGDSGMTVVNNDELRSDPVKVMMHLFDFLDMDYRENELFGVVKYSNGSNLSTVSEPTFNYLADLLYPDYEAFCNAAGIQFSPLTYPSDDSLANVVALGS